MSRIGRKVIQVPAGVKVAINGQAVTITGPKGSLAMNVHPDVKVVWSESEKSIRCSVDPDRTEDRQARALWGTSRALLQTAVLGVVTAFEKQLEVVGVGWTAAVTGGKLKLVVGFANSIMLDIPKDLAVTVDKQLIKISGADKQKVGHFAASARAVRKPEPYNGKGIKYVNEVIRRKQGKQFGTA